MSKRTRVTAAAVQAAQTDRNKKALIPAVLIADK